MADIESEKLEEQPQMEMTDGPGLDQEFTEEYFPETDPDTNVLRLDDSREVVSVINESALGANNKYDSNNQIMHIPEQEVLQLQGKKMIQ